MSETRQRRYIVTGEGISATGESLEEARARFRNRQPGDRRVTEPVRIPVSAEPEPMFEGERFFDSLDVLRDVRHQRAS